MDNETVYLPGKIRDRIQDLMNQRQDGQVGRREHHPHRPRV